VVVCVLAAVAVANALVTSTRRRRTDLAVLKALGAGGRQLRRMVAWQSTTWAGLSVVVGVPVGLVVGAAGWEAITGSLGLRRPTAFPAMVVGTVALVVMATANARALFAGRAATRIPTAEALRIE
jgi:predicted lysophospholipase L1 biosynthesis ABC-type transport system permease subunit